MISVRGGIVSGMLCEWSDKLVHGSDFWSKLPHVSTEPVLGGRWRLLVYRTQHFLAPEDIPDSAGAYVYEFLVRATPNRALILGAKQRYAEAFLNRNSLMDQAKFPRVEIEKLVEDLCEKPHEYLTLSRVYAGIEGFGKDLTSITLYGDNLVKRSLHSLLSFAIYPFRVELSDVRFSRKLLSVNKRGEINFFYADDRSLKQVDDTLMELTKKHYFRWGDEPHIQNLHDAPEADL